MKVFIPLLLVPYLSWAAGSSPVVDPDKFTVCAITINSDDEKKVFQSQVSKYPKKFNPVVELTDMGDDQNWFKKACQSGVRCDQLIISGHFGGSFFGEKSKKKLSLIELEEAGCSKSCENVLARPYEVFLFGCNTLATKVNNGRDPDEYLRTLLRDGLTLQNAEMVVASRYGSLGDSNKAGMQRAFGGDKKNLYGFDDVGPSGKNVKKLIENYFSKVSPTDRLEKLQAKRMFNQVVEANQILAKSLKVTAFAQCESGEINDPIAKNICKLLDTKLSIKSKLGLSYELLGDEDYQKYLPAMNHFLKVNKPEKFTSDEKKELKLITDNKSIKDQVLGLVKTTKSLGLKVEWSAFAKNVGFLRKPEMETIVTEELKKLFVKPMSISTKDSVCSMSLEFVPNINVKDLKIKIGKNETAALQCLKVLK
jgi:hypothetical protein